MKHVNRRWACGLLGGLGALLALCAAVVATVDPFFHYHAPDPAGEVWFDERYQSAGLLQTQAYETVLLGTSLAANYRADWFDVYYQTKTVKITIPDGGFQEFTQVLDCAYDHRDVKRVIFGLDPNILVRDPAAEPQQLPDYLYDTNPWNDGQYLLNKDALLQSVYVLREKQAGRTQPLTDAFLWDGDVYFSKQLALTSYQRPPQAAETMAADALLENCDANLDVVTGWIEAHPDTEFLIYYPPYSILFWDKMQRLGETEVVFAALRYATETLLAYDNVELHAFLTDMELATDLDSYADHVHAAGKITFACARSMPQGKYRLTAENWAEKLDALHAFVVNYNYNGIFAGD